MRTNIDIDDEKMSEAARLTGLKEKKQIVDEALRVLIEVRKRRSLLELRGKVKLRSEYDHKKLRRG